MDSKLPNFSSSARSSSSDVVLEIFPMNRVVEHIVKHWSFIAGRPFFLLSRSFSLCLSLSRSLDLDLLCLSLDLDLRRRSLDFDLDLLLFFGVLQETILIFKIF